MLHHSFCVSSILFIIQQKKIFLRLWFLHNFLETYTQGMEGRRRYREDQLTLFSWILKKNLIIILKNICHLYNFIIIMPMYLCWCLFILFVCDKLHLNLFFKEFLFLFVKYIHPWWWRNAKNGEQGVFVIF